MALRAAAVNDGRRPPLKAARSVIEGGKHGADPQRFWGRLSSLRAGKRQILSSVSHWPAEVMVLSEVDARPPHHGFQGAVTPQCKSRTARQ